MSTFTIARDTTSFHGMVHNMATLQTTTNTGAAPTATMHTDRQLVNPIAVAAAKHGVPSEFVAPFSALPAPGSTRTFAAAGIASATSAIDELHAMGERYGISGVQIDGDSIMLQDATSSVPGFGSSTALTARLGNGDALAGQSIINAFGDKARQVWSALNA